MRLFTLEKILFVEKTHDKKKVKPKISEEKNGFLLSWFSRLISVWNRLQTWEYHLGTKSKVFVLHTLWILSSLCTRKIFFRGGHYNKLLNSNKNNNKTISVVAPNQSLLAFFDYFRNWKAQFHLLRLWLSHRVPFWRSTTNDPRGQDNRNEPQNEADASERNAGVDDIAVASRSFMMNDSSFPIIAPTFYEWQVVEISKRPQKSNRVQHYIGNSHTFSSVLRAATLASHDGRTDQRQNR